MNFRDVLIDSAIKAGIELLVEIGQQREKPARPKVRKYRVKKKPEKK
jgi:hypothetical protein